MEVQKMIKDLFDAQEIVDTCKSPEDFLEDIMQGKFKSGGLECQR